MIENMRKYTGLMVIVLILLAAGLILTMGTASPNAGGRGKVTEVYGEAIDQIEYRKLGLNSINVIKELSRTRMFYNDLASFAMGLITQSGSSRFSAFGFSRTPLREEDVKNFVTRRIVIAKTAAEYGIYPSTELAQKHIKEKIFVVDEKFDAAGYQDFMKDIGSSGIQEEDFIKLVAEALVYEKLKNLVSSGLESPNTLTDRAIKFQQQTLDLTTIDINIDPYKKDINPTEEEIKTYWGENDFKYLTDRQIRVSYILEKPVYRSERPEAPVRTPEMKDEEFKELDDAYQKALAKWELEVEKPTDNALAGKIDDLAYIVDESDGAKFTEEVKAAEFKLHEIELFTEKNIPEELKLLNNKEGNPISKILFQTKITDSLKYRIPAPIRLEGNGWFYVRFDEEVKPQVMTFEEAKDRAKEDYIQEKAHTAMLAAVDEIKEKVTKSIVEGATPEEAAKIYNLSANNRNGMTIQSIPRDQFGNFEPTEYSIFQNGTITTMSSFAEENVELKDKVVLVFLNKRQVVNTTEVQDARINIQNSRSEILQNSVFSAWMKEVVAKANIPPLQQ